MSFLNLSKSEMSYSLSPSPSHSLSLPLSLSLLFLFISQDKPDAPALHIAPKEATVTFENVHFSYTPDRPILNGLDFRVPAGKKVALVGGSGSG